MVFIGFFSHPPTHWGPPCRNLAWDVIHGLPSWGYHGGVPCGYVNSLLLKIAIEIVDFPIFPLKTVDLSSSLCKRLPEGNSQMGILEKLHHKFLT